MKQKLHIPKKLVGLFALALLGATVSTVTTWALNTYATGYKTTTTARYIAPHNVCEGISHPGGSLPSGTTGAFAPTRTVAEWVAYRAAVPSLSYLTATVCPPGIWGVKGSTGPEDCATIGGVVPGAACVWWGRTCTETTTVKGSPSYTYYECLDPQGACEASSGTYPAKHDSNSLQTTANGRWMSDKSLCLEPWSLSQFSADHNDNERLGPTLTRTINVCSYLTLSTGDEFFITSDVAGGSWVVSGSRFNTAVFKKGISAANSEIANGSGGKNHYSWREYDGNCTVTLKSRQGNSSGDRTDWHDQAISTYNLGHDATWGGNSTGTKYACSDGSCAICSTPANCVLGQAWVQMGSSQTGPVCSTDPPTGSCTLGATCHTSTTVNTYTNYECI